MLAHKLAQRGLRIAILERGGRVTRGPHNWDRDASLDLTPHYDKNTQYHVTSGGNKPLMGLYSALGGPSVFYGGVSWRFREADFEDNAGIISDSGAAWPISYQDLESYYTQAEQILQIAGDVSNDPTEPYRSAPLPYSYKEYADISQRVSKAASDLGLHPSGLPLAINFNNRNRPICQRCTTCDTFACAVEAKNDLATMVLDKEPVRSRVDIYTEMMVTQLVVQRSKITTVKAFDTNQGEEIAFSADLVCLSAGALGSAHLVLSSGLDQYNSASDHIGRYLMRHVNAITFGIFPSRPDKQQRFHKELAIMDYYHGHQEAPDLGKKIGSLQQIATPPPGLVESYLPPPFGKPLSKAVGLLTGLLAIAEDQPQYHNHIKVDRAQIQKDGLAKASIEHKYSARDSKAIDYLGRKASKVMKKTGALLTYTHHIKTFSHAVGTIRMGLDPLTAPLDADCKFRGLDNLYVVDGSFMPTSAAVNPSLTISANALRVADHIIRQWPLT